MVSCFVDMQRRSVARTCTWRLISPMQDSARRRQRPARRWLALMQVVLLPVPATPAGCKILTLSIGPQRHGGSISRICTPLTAQPVVERVTTMGAQTTTSRTGQSRSSKDTK